MQIYFIAKIKNYNLIIFYFYMLNFVFFLFFSYFYIHKFQIYFINRGYMNLIDVFLILLIIANIFTLKFIFKRIKKFDDNN